MTVEWFRDLVIALTGVVAIGVLLFFAVISYSIYRRVRRVLDSAEAILSDMQKVASRLDEVTRPLIQIVAIVKEVRQCIYTVSELFQGRGK